MLQPTADGPLINVGGNSADGQLALASKIINSGAINRVVRQYIDGEIDAATAVATMNDELSSIQ